MFFVVLWEVVSPLRAIFDIMTQNRENRKKRVQKRLYFGSFEAILKIKYERGYFRSLGRGGKNSKNAFPFFSIGRTTMRQCALERSMSQVYQTIFLCQ